MANTETYKLYNDEVEIIFYPDSHRYREPGQKTYLVSNTSVTGIISPYGKLEALKQWSVNIGCDYMAEYLNEMVFGELDDEYQEILKETDLYDLNVWFIASDDEIRNQLLEVAKEDEVDSMIEICQEQIKVSMQSISLEEIRGLIEDARYKHKDKLEEAASLGDEVHGFAEEFARRKVAGEEMTEDMLEFKDERATQMAESFLDWVDEHDVEFVEAERLGYSKTHNYVGTFDALAYVDGKLTLIDYKTSKYVYLGHKLQLAGYWNSRQEEADYTGEDLKIEQAMVVRFDKDPDSLEFTPENNVWLLTEEHYPLFRDTFLNALKVKEGLKEIDRL